MGNHVQHKSVTRLARREEKAGARLPYRRHLDDVTLLLRDGGLMQTLHITGFPFETSDSEELNHRQAVRDVMLRSINNHQFTLHHHIVRRRVSASLDGGFPDPVSGGIDRLWQARLGRRRLFVNELFLTLVYRPKSGKRGLLTRLSARRATQDAQLGQAVAKLSHDLRNMLTTIQMLSDTLSLSKDPSVNRLTPKLVKNVERAVALTEGALTFGKAEEPAPQPEYIDLNVFVDEVIENEQKFINGRDIAIEKEITVSEKIFADPDQLYRVLGNLVRNALQAIIDTGEIKFSPVI